MTRNAIVVAAACILGGLLCVVFLTLPARQLSEDEFLRNLSVEVDIDKAELHIDIKNSHHQPQLWHVNRLYVVTDDNEYFLGETERRLGQLAVTRRVPLKELPDYDESHSRVRVEYAIFNGPPDNGQQLFQGEVELEPDATTRSSDG